MCMHISAWVCYILSNMAEVYFKSWQLTYCVWHTKQARACYSPSVTAIELTFKENSSDNASNRVKQRDS